MTLGTDAGERCGHSRHRYHGGGRLPVRLDKPRVAPLTDDQLDPELHATDELHER